MASPASSCPRSHLDAEIEIESPSVSPASPAAAACTSTAMPSWVTAPSTYGAADLNSRNGYHHTVFLNYHEQDVKNTIASHLCGRLSSHGIQVFPDRWELRKGQNFPDKKGDAIKNASVHVAIFSARYAESECCLNELVNMLKTKAYIIPVFYNVKPRELRLSQRCRRDGIYAQGLQKLKKQTTHDPETHEEKQRFSPTTISIWCEALHTVSETTGFELDAFNGDEGMLVVEVVQAVLRRIKETGLFVAKHPVGLHVKVKELEDTVKLQSGKPQVLGIVGMCGVGKTTLAREFFNRKRSYYEKSYFLSNISLYSGQNKRGFCIESVDEGIETLKMQLSSFNAIVVLDGVDYANQMDTFLPVLSVLGPNSLILITSRNKDVLTGSGFQNASIYKLTGLNAEYSQQLFCSHAFSHSQSQPLPGFEPLVEKIVETCQGSPLSLKLSGELVCVNTSRSHWKDQLDRLPQILAHDIRDRLQISYDALHRVEKRVFLDTANFFIGERVDMAIRIWDALGLKGSLLFQNLVNKSLVEVDSEGKIKMHNPVRDMGREIAEEPSGSPLRLWSRKQVDHLLQQSSGRTEVLGIRTRMDDDDTDSSEDSAEMSCYRRWSHELLWNHVVKSCNNTCFRGSGARNLHLLQLLATEGVQLERILSKVHSPNPIWLRWLKCPYYSLPTWFPLKNSRVLELSGRFLKRLWRGKYQAPLQLRELVVDSPLSKIPKSIGCLNHLERIVLRNNNLKSLPESFGNLKKLKYLALSHSPSLQKLPNSLGNLINLEYLDLSVCKSLQELPNSFGDLTQLKHLHLSHSFSLKMLPNSFGNLRNLEHLNLSYSQSLQGLPNSFGDLTRLKRLDLSNSSSLHEFPKSFSNLIPLDYLDLRGCPNLIVSRETLLNIRPPSQGIPIVHQFEVCTFQVISESNS